MVALGLLSACGPAEERYWLELHTRTCSGTPALEGVRYLRYRITGEDMEPVERYVPVEEVTELVPEEIGSITLPPPLPRLPPVPVGKGRVLELRGYTDLPRSGGRVVALGRSRPFMVEAGGSRWLSGTVPIAVRRVDEYVRPATSEGGCVSLAESRAAHTATLLESGQVVLAGGFQAGADHTMWSQVEIFDPLPGSVRAVEGHWLRVMPRAFHTATLLPGYKVLLAGGQMDSVEGTLPLQSAQVLDLVSNTATEVQLKVARSQHAAAVDSGGRVLFVGGVGAGGAVVAEAEGYDPATGQVLPVSTPVPRVGMSVMPVQDGRRIAVVGGSDGASLRPEVLFFSFEGGSFVPVGESVRLRQPRRDAALVPFGGPDRLLYVGGSDSPDGLEAARFLASSEVVSPGAATQVSPGLQVFARSGLCAVTLPDGRVMTFGGLRYNGGALVSDPHAELLVPGKDGAAPGLLGLKPLDRPRHQHSCTVLQDGSVLIAGGVEDTGTQRTTLDDLVLYMPAPLD
jgi:hypothetical protein